MVQAQLPHPFKIFLILRIAARPAPFNDVNSKGIQALRDLQLVKNGKIDPFGLRTIP